MLLSNLLLKMKIKFNYYKKEFKMKKISLLLLLLNTYNFVSSMECDKYMVILPSKPVLLNQLQSIKEYKHFFQNSTFLDKFSNRTEYAPMIFAHLGFHIDEYRERFKNDMQAFHLEMLKPKVVTLMLQDYPNTIAFLKKENVLAELVSPSIFTNFT